MSELDLSLLRSRPVDVQDNISVSKIIKPKVFVSQILRQSDERKSRWKIVPLFNTNKRTLRSKI